MLGVEGQQAGLTSSASVSIGDITCQVGWGWSEELQGASFKVSQVQLPWAGTRAWQGPHRASQDHKQPSWQPGCECLAHR